MLRIFIVIGLTLTAVYGAETRVDNGLKPESSPMTLVFEEDLRISPESGESHHIWTGASVTVDANRSGHIFVTDPGGSRILLFDAEGALIKEIGGKGEGPGEFQILSSFKILDDQTGIAFDNMQVSVTFTKFDKGGAYVDRTTRSSFGMIIQSAIFSSDAEHLGSFYMIPNADGTTIKAYTGFLSRDFKPGTVITENTLNRFNMNELANPSWWAGYLAQWFEMIATGIGVMACGPNGEMFTASSNKYEITRWDRDMNKTLVVSRKYKPVIRTEAETMALIDPIREEMLSILPPSLQQYATEAVVRRGVEKAELPPAKPPIFAIIPMEEGGFLAIHNYDSISGESIADIFSKQGRYLGQAKLPPISVNFFGSLFGNNTKMVFKNGYAYTIEDREDEAHMVRYKHQMVPAKGSDG